MEAAGSSLRPVLWLLTCILASHTCLGIDASCPAAVNKTGSAPPSVPAKLPPPDLRYAIIVGVGHYEDSKNIPDVDGPENDVPRIAQSLEENMGIPAQHIFPLSSQAGSPFPLPDRPHVTDAFRNLHTRVLNGLLVVVFSGHGISLNHDPRVLLWDSRALNDAELAENSTRVSYFVKKITELHPAQVLLFVDACQQTVNRTAGHDNTLKPEFRQEFFKASKEVEASAILLATDDGHLSYVNKKHVGYFMDAVADGLSGAGSLHPDDVRLSELVGYVEKVVPKKVKADQINAPQCPTDLISGVDPHSFSVSDASRGIEPGSVERTIRFTHARTDDVCANIPGSPVVSVSFDAGPSVSAYFSDGCMASFHIAPEQIGQYALVKSANLGPFAMYSPAQKYTTVDSRWSIPLIGDPDAIRISLMAAGEGEAQAKIAQILRESSDLVANRLTHLDASLDYLNNLTVVQTGVDSSAAGFDFDQYLADTNSLQTISITSEDPQGIHVLLESRTASQTQPIRKLSMVFPATDLRFSSLIYSAILKGVLAENAARSPTSPKVRRVLTDEALNALTALPFVSNDVLEMQHELQAMANSR